MRSLIPFVSGHPLIALSDGEKKSEERKEEKSAEKKDERLGLRLRRACVAGIAAVYGAAQVSIKGECEE